jgi:hypothetical protein
VLIAPSGHAVEGLTADGLEFSDEPVMDTDVDVSRPNAKPRLAENAAELLANAMSKEDFLAAVRDLLSTVPLQGEFPQLSGQEPRLEPHSDGSPTALRQRRPSRERNHVS